MQKRTKMANSGFTILELIVVVGIMALITSLSTKYIVKETNQKRYTATRERIEQIRYAIVGDSSRTLNNQPAFSGYISDTGSVPRYLRDLVSNGYCTNTAFRTKDTCLAGEGEWREAENWKGPYLRATGYKDIPGQDGQVTAKIPVFRDGWGNREQNAASEETSVDNLNFGWVYNPETKDGAIRIVSLGLNGSEKDDKMSSRYIYEQDMVSSIPYTRIAGAAIGINVINNSAYPVSQYCIKALYSDGTGATIDLATEKQLPAAKIFGGVRIFGLLKKSPGESCKQAENYAGIREAEVFSHNLFTLPPVELVIQ